MPCSGAGRVQEMSGAAVGRGGWAGGQRRQGRAAFRQLGQPSICASPLYSSFLAALSALPSLACLPDSWALRPALSQLHMPPPAHLGPVQAGGRLLGAPVQPLANPVPPARWPPTANPLASPSHPLPPPPPPQVRQLGLGPSPRLRCLCLRARCRCRPPCSLPRPGD